MRRKGQGLVEFALILPALLLVVLGIIESAFVIQGYLTVQHAAREAARFASTYQPPRGACLDLDEDGVLEDGVHEDPDDIALAASLSPDGDGYPYCPSEGDPSPHADLTEPESDYYDRRVHLIKQRAREAAIGLRIDETHLGFTPSDYKASQDETGFFGVEVWGRPSFQTDWNVSWDPGNPCLDHPGIEGDDVLVRVRHNVPIADPLYQTIAEHVPVTANSLMKNEGVQVGLTDADSSGYVPAPEDPDYDEPDPTAFHVALSPESANIVLPDDTTQEFVATVTQGGSAAAGETVRFSIDSVGDFVSSGSSQTQGTTDAQGEAVVTVESDYPGTATLRAWLDDNGNGQWDSGEPYDVASVTWVEEGYAVSLSPTEAVNELPDDRSHQFIATVTDAGGRLVEGAQVSFSIDEPTLGGFDYSGIGPKYIEKATDQQGETAVTVYGNYSGTVSIRAWIDIDADDVQDGNEPSAEATKTWRFAEGTPYITVSSHEAAPLDEIRANVMEHSPADEPYRLLWCVISSTSPITQVVVENTVDVDADGNATDIPYIIPADSEGTYRLETHPAGGGGCGAADIVARSADIQVQEPFPDLAISAVDPLTICPKTVFTMSTVITNLTQAATDEAFDVDFYVDDEHTPQAPVGEMKQWVDGIGPNESIVLNTLMWVDSPGEHTIWARVDTSDYVYEDNESNNWDVLQITTGGENAVGFADFDDGTDDFSYVDDAFGTNEPNYAEGERVSSGGYSGGALRVGLGAINGNNYDIDHMSGGWRRTFDLNSPQIVVISFRYNLIHAPNYESGEYSDVLMSVDGATYGSDGNGYVARVDGDGEGGEARTTGWQQFEVEIGPLSAGSHTLTIGGYNRRKTYYDEYTEVLIDEVNIGTAICGEGTDPAPWAPGAPLGREECYQLLENTGFEGNFATVFGHWSAGEPGAFQRGSLYFYEGTSSMRLHASQSSPPSCAPHTAYVHQTVQVPEEISEADGAETTLHVQGRRLIADSLSTCSVPNSVDVDDELHVQLRDAPGDPSHLIAQGTDDMARVIPDADGYVFNSPAWNQADAVCRPSRKGLSAPAPSVSGQSGTLNCPIEDDFNDDFFDDSQWTESPIGNSDGSVSESGSELTINAYGSSTWGSNDDMYYVHQPVDGNFDAKLRITDGLTRDQWAKIGLMVRNSTADNSRYVMLSFTHNHSRLQFAYRPTDGGGADRLDGTGDDIPVDLPVWVRIVRTGNTFGYYFSEATDPGSGDWTYQGSVDIPMNNTVQVGIGHASYSSYDTDQGSVDEMIVCQPPTVDFNSTDYTVNEDAGTATITVTLNVEIDTSISVDYATSDITAVAGDDYTNSSGTVNFAPNETTATFEVPIIDDSQYEQTETVLLELSNPTEAVIGPNDPATLTIVDDDPLPGDGLKINFEPPGNDDTPVGYLPDTGEAYGDRGNGYFYGWDQDVNENRDRGDHSDERYDTLNHMQKGDPRTWEVSVPNGAYDVHLVMGDPSYTDQINTVNVEGTVIPDPDGGDAFDEYNPTVNVTDGRLTIAPASGSSNAKICFVHIVPARTIDFSDAIYNVDEGVGEAIITVTLDTTAGTPVEVDYETNDDTATAGEDYTDSGGTLTFDPGETVLTFTVPISDDTTYEGDEALMLNLYDASNASIGTNDPATLNILENDPEPDSVVQFSDYEYSVHEGEDAAVITVTLNAPYTQPVTVDYATQDDTAVAPDDYTSSSGSVEIEVGEEIVTFTVPINDDTLYEGAEEVELELFNATNAVLGAYDTATLTIVDDEPTAPRVWKPFDIDFSSDFDVSTLAGQEIEVRFYTQHDGDQYGTWFYLDDLACEICNTWPAPDPEPGTASIGGEARVLVGGVPEALRNVNVTAYTRGGEVLRTVTVQNGLYHFYNVAPGSYTIYAETWIDGDLYVATKTVMVGAGERNYDVDLLLY
jgi:hypothetical protein